LFRIYIPGTLFAVEQPVVLCSTCRKKLEVLINKLNQVLEEELSGEEIKEMSE